MFMGASEMKNRIPVEREAIERFCRRWQIAELAAFGSVLREDFTSSSDIDVLVTFSAGADWSFLDHIQMEDELSEILGRKADLVTRRAVEHSRNWIRKKAILS